MGAISSSLRLLHAGWLLAGPARAGGVASSCPVDLPWPGGPRSHCRTRGTDHVRLDRHVVSGGRKKFSVTAETLGSLMLVSVPDPDGLVTPRAVVSALKPSEANVT